MLTTMLACSVESSSSPFLARHDRGGIHAELRERLGIDGCVIGAGDADQLAADMGWIGQRPHQVEDGAAGDAAAQRPIRASDGWCAWANRKAMPSSVKRFLGPGAGTVEIEAERLQRVGRARFGRGGAVAMLGDRHARRGDDQAHRGRDVEGVMPIAAGAAHVDRAFGSGDRNQPGAHRPCRLGDLDAGFAAYRKLDQEMSRSRARAHCRRECRQRPGRRIRGRSGVAGSGRKAKLVTRALSALGQGEVEQILLEAV